VLYDDPVQVYSACTETEQRMRPKLFRVAALVGVAIVALLFFVLRPMGHGQTVKAYFTNAGGLRDGAQVRAAGVEIGSVRSVRVRPELHEEPVEVVMVLNPRYEVRIPADSIVSLETEGLLGPTYVEIDATGASGPPIATNAVLKTRPIVKLTTEQLVENLSKMLENLQTKCGCGTQTDKTSSPTAPTRKPIPK
jgi:phospholipid/cholesterol/gamma-HCH transport system substrate-binding protein